jgi:hypothetical protein
VLARALEQGTQKQACVKRRCANPVLPAEAAGASALGGGGNVGRSAYAYEGPGYEGPGYEDDANKQVRYDYFCAGGSAYEAGPGVARQIELADADDVADPACAAHDAAEEAWTEEEDVVFDEAEGGHAPDGEVAGLRRQLALEHRRARAYRRRAEEMIKAAHTLYPLALASRPSLCKPECLERPRPPLPPLKRSLPLDCDECDVGEAYA